MTSLPEFENPPVVEVALGVYFAPLSGLSPAQVGAYWDRSLRQRLPISEMQPPISAAFEEPNTRHALGEVRFEVSRAAPAVRFHFLDSQRSELVQIQQDFLARNWTKTSESNYPRFPRLRTPFESELVGLSRFITSEKIGTLRPTQCEVTYTNHILWEGDQETHKRVSDVLSILSVPEALAGARFEDLSIQMRNVLLDDSGQFRGRLHVAAQPVIRRDDGQPVIRLILTARGAPLTSEVDSVMEFMDLGHEQIVRSFAEITTSQMHDAWGRTR